MDPDEAELKAESSGSHEVGSRDRGSSYDPSDSGIRINANAGYALALSPAEYEDYQPSGNASPRKRPAEGTSASRPFKRQKGIFNAEYLDLLNRDIDDAARRVCWDEDVQFSKSQIGLTKWSAAEKRQFFEAVSRLGKYDLPGIAARIGTKSEIEVQQYICLLRDGIEQRKSQNSRSYLETAQYPAAVELSQHCCHAQEEAADAISVRQERREEQREELKWGPNWDITPPLARKLSRDLENGEPLPDKGLQFAQLFHLPTWLSLSERVFMNSSIPGNNWNYIDDKQPSMWATAFDDFYALAVSITRRLVQSSLFISSSRIRAKMELHPTTRHVVRKRDVEAAIASLNMPRNSYEMWRMCARRLRLDVFDEPPDRNDDDDDDDDDDADADDGDVDAASISASAPEEEPMSYDKVEQDLICKAEPASEEQSPDPSIWKLAAPSDGDCEPIDDLEQVYDARVVSDEVDNQQDTEDEEDDEADWEMREIQWHATADVRNVRTAKEALRLRIEAERRQEAQAERHDDYASHQAEGEMWAVLQRKPPVELARVQEPGRVQMSNLELDRICPLGRNWASSLEYCEEWETLDTTPREDEEEQDGF
ncbi:hypothetical protein E4U42_001533 [Claviceps africana]|uniref:Uncharacterized protein n=1 Tax=Claviceps africana TaxID=83212 RepID=A0A8K0NI01_9HYPO|nr:hypothetical protein E4U42_001533 [Claviceps africana]